MAVYKVPQNVEAEDKLLGPFSFRQFIYLVISVVGIAIAWVMFSIFPPLVVIPLPFIIIFGVLALPLKKDQPMEVYLAAMVSFFFKPKQRPWIQGSGETLLTITAPTEDTNKVTLKDFSQEEAQKRIDYLSKIADTQGWSVKGLDSANFSTMQQSFLSNSADEMDILDENSATSITLDRVIQKKNLEHKQQLVNNLSSVEENQKPEVFVPKNEKVLSVDPDLNKQPVIQSHEKRKILTNTTNMNRDQNKVPILPKPIIDNTIHKEKQPQEVSDPDIINLANNRDLSIATIAREAERIKEKKENQEVFIALR